MGTLALANTCSSGLRIKASFSCCFITSMLYVGEKNVGSRTSLLPHDFTPLILGLIIAIYYMRGLLLNLKMEGIISFLINSNIYYILMRALIMNLWLSLCSWNGTKTVTYPKWDSSAMNVDSGGWPARGRACFIESTSRGRQTWDAESVSKC